MRFEVGSWYSFTISGLKNISEKGDYYVLMHESGRKMLLRSDYYSKYNFTLGQCIECRIDKVNCTGQVFLEPKHPNYSEGNSYPFILTKIFDDEKSLYNATVKDIYDNEIDVFINSLKKFNLKHSILLKVIQVKKGIPTLSHEEKEITKISGYKIGEKLLLTISAIKKYNSESYFILNEGSQEKSKIKVKHYKKYGFAIGDKVKCEVTKFGFDNSLIVEPINPWYEVGKTYSFQVERITKFIDLEGNEATKVIALDIVKNKCGFVVDENIAKQLSNINEIKCKVNGFRKGRPLLEIDPLYY